MATYKPPEFEQLLAPISEQSPCGEDLKFDLVLDEIKTARRDANRNSPESGQDEGSPGWKLIVDRTTELLTKRSKDLMLAGWLMEALINIGGFAGCRDGVKLINELLERFWDNVFPIIPSDGTLDARLAPLHWCIESDRGGKLPFLLRTVQLFPGNSKAKITLNYWESCFRTIPKGATETPEDYADRKSATEERVRIYQEAKQEASLESLRKLTEDLKGALTEITRLEGIVQTRFALQAPSVSPLRKVVEECAGIVAGALQEKGGPDVPNDMVDQGGTETDRGTGSQRGGLVGGAICSRDDAINRLAEIASYLRKVEPHSPVSYLVQRAVNWGRMPFDQLLKELLKDESVRNQVGELLGLPPPSSD